MLRQTEPTCRGDAIALSLAPTGIRNPGDTQSSRARPTSLWPSRAPPSNVAPMLRFILGRLVSLGLSLIAASLVIFVVIEVVPGDPAAFMLGLNANEETVQALREDLGLTGSKVSRYITWITGLVLAILVGAVILGGIRRIGAIAGTVVPIMCALYVISGLAVLVANAEQLPAMFHLIFVSAFSPAEGVGAFTGAAFGTTFIFGMKRALFSSEAGLGSAPIAHSAVKTSEPVTEGVVAGLEPFIDTIVVCTITALVILSSGVWSRAATAEWMAQPTIVESSPGTWVPSITTPPQNGEWTVGDQVFVVVEVEQKRASLFGDVVPGNDGPEVRWRALESESAPVFAERGLFSYYPGATLTAKAFDSAFPGLGRWMVTLTVWFFALSTIITWSYYAEQGVVYLLGERAVTPYRLLWCVLVFVTCLGFIKTDTQLDTLSTIALGFMLAVNLPTMVLLGGKAMGAYKDYFRRLKLGTLGQDK